METVTEVSVSKLESSRYMKPLRLHYTQNGIAKMWDLGMSAPSVAVVIYNKSRKTLVLVKQLRPAVLFAEILNNSYANADDLEKLNQLLSGNFLSLCLFTYVIQSPKCLSRSSKRYWKKRHHYRVVCRHRWQKQDLGRNCYWGGLWGVRLQIV